MPTCCYCAAASRYASHRTIQARPHELAPVQPESSPTAGALAHLRHQEHPPDHRNGKNDSQDRLGHVVRIDDRRVLLAPVAAHSSVGHAVTARRCACRIHAACQLLPRPCRDRAKSAYDIGGPLKSQLTDSLRFRWSRWRALSQHLLASLRYNIMVPGCPASGNPMAAAELVPRPNRRPVATGSPGRAGR